MDEQSQLELFKQHQYKPKYAGKDKRSINYFSFIRIHEKAICIIIVFFIISLFSFSLGVERGKRIAGNKVKDQSTNRIIAKPSGSSLEDRQEAARIEKPAAVVDLNKSKTISSQQEEKTEEPAKEYTIQVASFKTKTYAQKEAVRLEQKGIKALLMPRGNFVIVCVGNFSQKQEANTSLTELKKIYQDCFIRRL